MSEGAPTVSEDAADPPPSAPEVGRRLELAPAHATGAVLLTSIVLLAAFGVFGESRASASASGAELEVAVEHPTRLRYGQGSTAEVRVTNRSRQIADTVTVAFDPAWMSRFDEVQITPSPARVWEVELAGVRPGETRRVVVWMRAVRYGGGSGAIRAFAAASDTTSLRVATFVLP